MVWCTYGRTGSAQTLHRVEFEVKPQDDHGFKGATVSKRSQEPLRYRGNSNMAALGVAGVIKEDAHERRYGYSLEVIDRSLSWVDQSQAKYMTLTEELKEDTWLKELFTESGFELSLVVGIDIGALIKAVPIRGFSTGRS
ncbi:hypothetical protein Tco_1008307 [Tanacetum coccineum]